jgi:hypothetical protein
MSRDLGLGAVAHAMRGGSRAFRDHRHVDGSGGGPSGLTAQRKVLNIPSRATSNIARMTSRSFGRLQSWLSNLKSVCPLWANYRRRGRSGTPPASLAMGADAPGQDLRARRYYAHAT